MSEPDILHQIDTTLEDWERRGDAARWPGEPMEEDDKVLLPSGVGVSADDVAAAFAELAAIVRTALTDFGRHVQPVIEMLMRVYLATVDRQPQRPPAAADRTNSPRKRAGMRRTKHQARKRRRR